MRRQPSLRSQLNQIGLWVRQGRTDAWIAHKLDVSIEQLERFKRDHDLEGGGEARSAPGQFSPQDIKSLLCPTEHSRFLLAVVACSVVLGLVAIVFIAIAGVVPLLAVLAFFGAFAGFIWFLIQMGRARLLGRSVQVTNESLPQVQAILDEVREMLDYGKPIEVYVIETAHDVSLTSYLGTKIILIKGSLIADLLNTEGRPQLTFMIARVIGALKARHQRLDFFEIVIARVKSLKVINLFLLPYYRAVAYSGDQIGLACSGLRPALAATNRLLVGKELAPEIAVRGVIRQAALARAGFLPRFAQLNDAEPLLTNRYLNLLFFAARFNPRDFDAFRGELDEETNRQLGILYAASPHYHPHEKVEVKCPHCLTTNRALVGATRFRCGRCRQTFNAQPHASTGEGERPPPAWSA